MLILLLFELICSQAYTTASCVPGYTVYVPQLSQCQSSATLCPGNVISGNQFYNWGIITTTMGDVKFCTDYNIDNCTPNCLRCKSLSSTQCLICADSNTRTSIIRTPQDVLNQIVESCPCKAGYSETSPQTAKCIQCISDCQSCPNTSTCTNCNNGFYLNGSNTCSICIAPCQSCQSSTQCLSCVGSNISLSGTQCLCDSGYYWDFSGCSKCSNSCLTCEKNKNQCTTCTPGMYLTAYQCLTCSPICETCSGNANNCLSCKIEQNRALFNNSCICQSGQTEHNWTCQKVTRFLQICQSGYYLSNNYCYGCIWPCATCQSGPLTCLSCSGSNISQQGQTCKCNDGYYADSNQCSKCYALCVTCSSYYGCQGCNDVNSASNGISCVCKTGYYFQGVSCSQCQLPCLSCQTTATTCLSCAAPRILNGNTCICNNGSYWDGSSCQTCQWPCANCQATSLTCLTCSDANSHLQGSTCICNNGYYLSGNQCLLCQNLCQNCSALTICLSCVTNSTLSGTTCSCNNGYYQQSNQCLQCQYPCQNCQTSASTCLSCADPHSTLSGNTCPCNTGYYKSGSNCLICQWPCSTCQTTSVTCLTCSDSNSHIQGTTCICNNNYYLQSNSCLQCELPCLNCQTTATTCLSCADPHSTLSGNTCPCNNGYYWNGSSCQTCQWPCANCQTTSLTCLTCSDTNSHLQGSTCICNNGYYLSGNQCLLCQNLCQNCLTSTSCLTCRDINSTLNGTTCSCNNGYYQSSNQCLQCQYPCQNCQTSASTCLSCADPYSTLNGNTCPCNTGYYWNGASCQICQWPCSTCQTTSLTCLTCSNSNSHIQGTTCICNNGYYLQSNSCLQCQFPCLNCQTTATTCLSCADGFYLNGNQCSQCELPCQNCISLESCLSCQGGYYLEGNQCLECQFPCQNCLSESICLSCYNDLQGLTVRQSQFFYLENTQCHVCKPPCQQCSSDTYCLTCIDADNLSIIQGQCICQTGYYLENIQCLNCPPLCSSCISEFQCLSCVINAVFDIESRCSCQIGYFSKDSICQKCSRNCEKCLDQFDNCTQCDEQSNFTLRNGSCQCKQCYYQDQQEICQKCDLNSQNKDCFAQQNTNLYYCDDGNKIIRDGCTNNQIEQNYQCFKLYNQLDLCIQLTPNCLQIAQQKQCVLCKDGYFLSQNVCIQCSDLCQTCHTQFQCLTCKYQIDKITQQCIFCNNGYYFDNFQCTPSCGDGIKTDEEQCDDGNQLDNDGCDKYCQILEGFECVEINSYSYCNKPNHPIPLIEIVQQAIKSPDKIFIKISYQQQLQAVNLELDKDLWFQIKDFNQSQYQVMMNTVIQDQYLIQIDAEIQLKQSLLEKTKMAIRFNTKQFRSLNNLTQQQQVYDIELPQFYLISEIQKQVTEVQRQVKDVVIISTGSIVLLSFLLGGLQLLLDYVDLIQFLSYLSYINTQYPYNYQQFMSILQYAQLSQVFNLLDISFINSFRSELDSYSSTDQVVGYIPTKMQIDGYKPQILINIPSIMMVWLILLVQYIFSILAIKLLGKFQINHLKLRSNTKIKLFSIKIKHSLVRQNNQNISMFFYSSIYRSIMATSYDTFIFISLSIANFTFHKQSLEIYVSQSLTLLIIIIYFRTIYYAWNILSSRKLDGYFYQQKIGSLIEGLRINNKSKYYNLCQILKKGIFMFCLVNLYQDSLYQIIALIFLNGIDLIYLTNFKVYVDKIDYFRTLTTQLQMFLHQMLISILVIDDFLSLFTPDYKEIFGWFLIANIQLLMIKQFLIYLYVQRKIYHKFIQLITKLIKQVLKKLLKSDKSPSGIKFLKVKNNRATKFPLQQLPF